MSTPSREPRDADDLLQAAPGLLRIAATAWLRTAEWTLSNWLHAGGRVLGAAASGEAMGQLLGDAGTELRRQARSLLGALDTVVSGGESRRDGDGDDEEPPAAPRRETLRDRGAELLRQSADVTYEEDAHPAYERILGELAPDEGRILRFLATEGPQPSVDVRAGKALNVGSQLVAPGLSMIGAQAGCRYVERVPAYLNNLYRLGLIWFSREPLENPLRYQVLEAQPDVTEALRGPGRSKTIRRSIHLTPFGDDFCEVCLPLNTAEIEALPGSVADLSAASPRPAPRPRPRPEPA